MKNRKKPEGGILANWKYYEELKKKDINSFINANVYVEKVEQDISKSRENKVK